MGNPISHAMDSDQLHFPGGAHFDLYHAFYLTKFMFLNLVAAAVVLGLFLLLAWNIRRNGYAKGALANALEAILLYVRREIAVPSIGEKDADRFMPLLSSLFIFILCANLLGMLPWLGSPTGALGTTAPLALIVFLVVHGSGIARVGPKHYAESFVPPVPWWLKPLIVPIEVISHLIRPCVLAFRLFVNMLAGHTVLFVFLSFIATVRTATDNELMIAGVTVLSLAAVVGLSMLELLVAFLQALVFTLLTAVYIGGAVHPHH